MNINDKEALDKNTGGSSEADDRSQKKPEQYEVGHDITNGKIKKIIAKSELAVMYISDTGTLGWKPDKEKVRHIPLYHEKVQRALELYERIPRRAEKKRIARYRECVGLCLFNAISSISEKPYEDYFKELELNIDTFIEDYHDEVMSNFIIWNIIHTALLSSLVAWLYFHICTAYSFSLIVTLGGALGACISVIQRNKKLNIRALRSFKTLQLTSVISVVLGMTSAFVVYWAIISNLALGFLAQTESGMFVFGVICGRSERYLNGLLTDIEESRSSKTKKAAPEPKV